MAQKTKQLTEKEKHIIQKMQMFPYTVEFCQAFLDEHPRTPIEEMVTPCATFLKTVRKLAKLNIMRINEGYIIVDSIHIGSTEFVLAKLDSEKYEMYVTWYTKNGTDFYEGDYTRDIHAAQKSLLDRAMKEYHIQESRRNPDAEPSVEEKKEVIIRLYDSALDSVVTNFEPLKKAAQNGEVEISFLQIDDTVLTDGLDDDNANAELAARKAIQERILADEAFVVI